MNVFRIKVTFKHGDQPFGQWNAANMAPLEGLYLAVSAGDAVALATKGQFAIIDKIEIDYVGPISAWDENALPYRAHEANAIKGI